MMQVGEVPGIGSKGPWGTTVARCTINNAPPALSKSCRSVEEVTTGRRECALRQSADLAGKDTPSNVQLGRLIPAIQLMIP